MSFPDATFAPGPLPDYTPVAKKHPPVVSVAARKVVSSGSALFWIPGHGKK